MNPLFFVGMLMMVLVLATGCTTNVYNVTIDNSVIDQSDTTQVLGCATDEVYDEALD